MTQFEEIKSLLGESLSYYLIAVDMDGNYSYLNKRYNAIFEPIHGNLIGRYYAITMHQDDQQTCKIVSQLAFGHPGRLFPATLRKHDGNGGYIITRWEYKAMFDTNGQPAGIFCIGHDITELVTISNELETERLLRSHKLRKPVANILGLCKLVDPTRLDVDEALLFEMILQCAHELDDEMRNPEA